MQNMPSKDAVFEHRYFSTYPVETENQALWLSKEPTFAIIKALWEAGPKGLTPKQVEDKLKDRKMRTGRSVIYQTLKALYEIGYVQREWDSEIGARRNILIERWLPASLDEDFDEWINENLGDEIEKTFFPIFKEFLEDVLERARKKSLPADFIPKQSEEAWCHNCEQSHEAQFFFLGLLYRAAVSFVFSPEEWEFNDPDLKRAIENLYISNKLASSKFGQGT